MSHLPSNWLLGQGRPGYRSLESYFRRPAMERICRVGKNFEDRSPPDSMLCNLASDMHRHTTIKDTIRISGHGSEARHTRFHIVRIANNKAYLLDISNSDCRTERERLTFRRSKPRVQPVVAAWQSAWNYIYKYRYIKEHRGCPRLYSDDSVIIQKL